MLIQFAIGLLIVGTLLWIGSLLQAAFILKIMDRPKYESYTTIIKAIAPKNDLYAPIKATIRRGRGAFMICTYMMLLSIIIQGLGAGLSDIISIAIIGSPTLVYLAWTIGSLVSGYIDWLDHLKEIQEMP